MNHLRDLKHDPRNARKHNPRNIGMIVDALHEVGAARSIVIDENNVILAGNGTIDAAAEAGIENVRIIEADGNEIIAVKRSGLTAEQKQRLALLDNRTAELADWDAEVIAALADEGFDLSGIFRDDELSELIASIEPEVIPQSDPDEVPDAPDEPITQPGDLILLGKHRLHNVFGIVLKELAVWRQSIQWVKQQFVFGRTDYHYRHEPIFYGWKEGAAHYFVDDRKQDSIWEIDRPKRSAEHPTMKPVELVERAINNSSKKGALVLDPFGGSGTTMIAAESTGRTAYLMELEPKYCDVIIARWEKFTGKTAQRPASQ